jgi:hypothetical protein
MAVAAPRPEAPARGARVAAGQAASLPPRPAQALLTRVEAAAVVAMSRAMPVPAVSELVQAATAAPGSSSSAIRRNKRLCLPLAISGSFRTIGIQLTTRSR